MPDDDLYCILTNLKNLPFRDHATEIGMICVLWGRLELSLDMLYVALLDTNKHTAKVIISGSSMREKCRNIRLLGFEKSPTPDWFSRLQSQLNRIDNDLRLERNRYVHDYWISSENDILQIRNDARLVKPQARQFAMKYHEISESSLGSLLSFQVKVMVATGEISALYDELTTSGALPPSP